MSDLLKEAIADAKAVRETALANAKMALEEAFTPHLKSMLSAKLAEDDMEDEEDVNDMEDEMGDEEEAEEGYDNQYREDDDEEMEVGDEEEVDESEIIEIDGVKYAPVVSEEEIGEDVVKEEEHEDEEEEDEIDESEELDLESVIKELEEELNESDPGEEEESVNEADKDDSDTVEEEVVTEEEATEEETVDEEVVNEDEEDDSEVVKEEDEKDQTHESVEEIQKELKEYKEAVGFLRDKLHEVNILNAKLLYTNKLFKEYGLSNDQKLKIVETFDRAQTTREIKLVYTTLAESFTGEKNEKKEVVKEFASKKSGGTAPSKKIISEENQVADRFRKLAGIL